MGINIRSVPKGVTGTYCAIVFFLACQRIVTRCSVQDRLLPKCFWMVLRKVIEGEIKDVNVTPEFWVVSLEMWV